MTLLTMAQIDPLVRAALEEDAGAGDITTDLLLRGKDGPALGTIRAKQDLVLSGIEVARHVFRVLDPEVQFQAEARDGDLLTAGDEIARVRGRASSLLIAERTALNFLGQMSGVATLTARFREAMSGGRVKLLSTRKTTPGLRALETYSVSVGGGTIHRTSLYDGVLLKDNHLAVGGGVTASIDRVRMNLGPARTIEVEVQDLEELEEALAAGADIVLLDNFSLDQLREAVARTAGRARLEASGGVSLETIGDIAATGVDAISVGALTHSAPCADCNMDLVPDDAAAE